MENRFKIITYYGVNDSEPNIAYRNTREEAEQRKQEIIEHCDRVTDGNVGVQVEIHDMLPKQQTTAEKFYNNSKQVLHMLRELNSSEWQEIETINSYLALEHNKESRNNLNNRIGQLHEQRRYTESQISILSNLLYDAEKE